MIITKIERQKKNSLRRSIFVDDKYSFSVSEDIFVRCSLYEGMQISAEEKEQIIASETEQHVKRIALKFRSVRMRSTYEVIEYLKKKGFDEIMIERAVDFLQRNHLLDDKEFAHSFCRDRLTLKPIGIRSMKLELQKRGIENALIDKVIQTYYTREKEQALAEQEAEKKLKRLRSLPPLTQKKRLFDHLVRKGYQNSLCLSIVNSMVKK
ncbi:MAG: RecX family transcriptional regulator [Bacteroidetes bacterium]|nr:RecX family transcriptional regulator [Bacteroidota bacterium]